jgi:dTDP-4-amino-4,6-dideoxygalactose transaminase
MKRYITFGRPDWRFTDLLYACIGALFRRDGSKALEQSISTTMGFNYVASTNLGRSAMRIALSLLADDKKGKILLPTLICSTVIDAVLAEGFEPVLVDVDDSFHVSPQILSGLAPGEAMGLIAAHLYGMQAPIGELEEWADSAGVFLIDDAAQVAGTKSGNTYLGGLGDTGLLSFGPFKSIGTPRCGAIITHNKPALKVAKARRISRESSFSAVRRIVSGTIKYKLGPWTYDFVSSWRSRKFERLNRKAQSNEQSSNKTYAPQMEPICEPSRFEALLAARVVSRTDSIIARRAKAGISLTRKLQDIPGIQVVGKYGTAYHKIPLRLKDPDQLHGLVHALKGNGIEVHRLYRPLHLNPEYAKYAAHECSNAESQWNKVLLIPCPVYNQEANSNRIMQAIRNFMEK